MNQKRPVRGRSASPHPKKRSLSQPVLGLESRGESSVAPLLAAALEASIDTPTDELTHGFHSYPGRMHPHLAASLLREALPSRSRVIDPFCGGGTVLLEAMLQGHEVVGADLNPLALRIAEVRCGRWGRGARTRFLRALNDVALRSEARVRSRTFVRAELPAEELRWYHPHVLKELAGLWEEIQEVEEDSLREAMEMVFSAMVVKFSRQRSETSERDAEKRLRKGLVTEFFHRKGEELVAAWAECDRVLPRDVPPPRLVLSDVRDLPRLLHEEAPASLLLSSPPYGGTYDYFHHHARRYPWLGLAPEMASEIGARRFLSGEGALARWNHELGGALRAMRSLLHRDGWMVLVLGDAQLEGRRIDASAQVEHLASSADLRWVATASVSRPDWTGRKPRREHVIALQASERASAREGRRGSERRRSSAASRA